MKVKIEISSNAAGRNESKNRDFSKCCRNKMFSILEFYSLIKKMTKCS